MDTETAGAQEISPLVRAPSPWLARCQAVRRREPFPARRARPETGFGRGSMVCMATTSGNKSGGLTAKAIAAQVANAGSGGAITEGSTVVLRKKTASGPLVWAEVEDGVWKVFVDAAGKVTSTTPQQTAPEVARELVRQFNALP